MKFILIVATGRSASTTLQRIINTIKKSNINGENWGAVNNLLECYHNIKKTKLESPHKADGTFYNSDECQKRKIKQAFVNTFDFEIVVDNIKKTILSILNISKDNTVYGFKEIRYFNKLYLIEQFLELFPNTKIICHIDENLDRQKNSAWHKKNPEASKKHLTLYNEQLINFVNSNENCYLSTRDNLFNLEEMKNLFIFIEEDLDEEEYNFILNDNVE